MTELKAEGAWNLIDSLDRCTVPDPLPMGFVLGEKATSLLLKPV